MDNCPGRGKKFRVPIVEGRPLDIYRLHKMVTEQGGFETVSKNKRWAYLAKQLNYKDAYTCTTLKMHYENILYPYILFEAGVTLPSESAGRKAADAETRSKKKTTTNANLDQDKIEHIKCLVCERGDDEAFMLLCDGCDDSYHTFCLYPALKEIPKGEWRCPLCIAHICKKPSDAYGFGQSKTEYNLRDFGKMADKFKAEYFKKNCQQVSLEECEREFWRILASPDQTVEVEYGADLHTLETGSGFPTKSNRGKYKECFDTYVNSPWNLNN
ncbi:lysine-specific demethylase 5A isoform X2, partial [Brachionus plicatilis]